MMISDNVPHIKNLLQSVNVGHLYVTYWLKR